MSDVDWRVWTFDKLANDAALIALLSSADNIFGGGSLLAPPETKPFLVIRLDPEVRGPFIGVSRQRVTLWAHDEPGDYMALDSVLRACRAALVGSGATVGQVTGTPGGVAVSWQGDSGDLADPDYGTILRTSSYDFQGKDGNA
jgi:hypothetical protein